MSRLHDDRFKRIDLYTWKNIVFFMYGACTDRMAIQTNQPTSQGEVQLIFKYTKDFMHRCFHFNIRIFKQDHLSLRFESDVVDVYFNLKYKRNLSSFTSRLRQYSLEMQNTQQSRETVYTKFIYRLPHLIQFAKCRKTLHINPAEVARLESVFRTLSLHASCA